MAHGQRNETHSPTNEKAWADQSVNPSTIAQTPTRNEHTLSDYAGTSNATATVSNIGDASANSLTPTIGILALFANNGSKTGKKPTQYTHVDSNQERSSRQPVEHSDENVVENHNRNSKQPVEHSEKSERGSRQHNDDLIDRHEVTKVDFSRGFFKFYERSISCPAGAGGQRCSAGIGSKLTFRSTEQKKAIKGEQLRRQWFSDEFMSQARIAEYEALKLEETPYVRQVEDNDGTLSERSLDRSSVLDPVYTTPKKDLRSCALQTKKSKNDLRRQMHKALQSPIEEMPFAQIEATQYQTAIVSSLPESDQQTTMIERDTQQRDDNFRIPSKPPLLEAVAQAPFHEENQRQNRISREMKRHTHFETQSSVKKDHAKIAFTGDQEHRNSYDDDADFQFLDHLNHDEGLEEEEKTVLLLNLSDEESDDGLVFPTDEATFDVASRLRMKGASGWELEGGNFNDAELQETDRFNKRNTGQPDEAEKISVSPELSDEEPDNEQNLNILTDKDILDETDSAHQTKIYMVFNAEPEYRDSHDTDLQDTNGSGHTDASEFDDNALPSLADEKPDNERVLVNLSEEEMDIGRLPRMSGYEDEPWQTNSIYHLGMNHLLEPTILVPAGKLEFGNSNSAALQDNTGQLDVTESTSAASGELDRKISDDAALQDALCVDPDNGHFDEANGMFAASGVKARQRNPQDLEFQENDCINHFKAGQPNVAEETSELRNLPDENEEQTLVILTDKETVDGTDRLLRINGAFGCKQRNPHDADLQESDCSDSDTGQFDEADRTSSTFGRELEKRNPLDADFQETDCLNQPDTGQPDEAETTSELLNLCDEEPDNERSSVIQSAEETTDGADVAYQPRMNLFQDEPQRPSLFDDLDVDQSLEEIESASGNELEERDLLYRDFYETDSIGHLDTGQFDELRETMRQTRSALQSLSESLFSGMRVGRCLEERTFQHPEGLCIGREWRTCLHCEQLIYCLTMPLCETCEMPRCEGCHMGCEENNVSQEFHVHEVDQQQKAYSG